MFLAFRDIRAAKGRFALIGVVVGLITLLIVMLTGLTDGLSKQNTSALESIDADRIVFAGQKVSYAESSIPNTVLQQWQDAEGVRTVAPVGITQTRLDIGSKVYPVAVFGLPSGTTVPGGVVPERGVLLPEDVESASSGQVSLGGTPVTLSSDSGVPTRYYSHQIVVWADLDTWRQVAHDQDPTVLSITGDLSEKEWKDLATQTGTQVVSVKESFAGLAAYQSERGSLQAIQVLLYGISALVIVAFLSVWTIQRTRDLAILRALGAQRSYVFKDSLGQAIVVLMVGVVGGVLFGVGLGLLAERMLPFSLTFASIVVPGLGVFVLGVLGALLATRRVLSTDPQLALGATA